MLAWLHAAPRPPEGSKRAGEPSKLARVDRMKRGGILPTMPPNPAPHIIARLIEIGITESGGMGPVPLSWREIAEWQRLTGAHLEAWEARLIRQLSVAYLAESRKAEDENCPPPWRSAPTQRERDLDEARLRAVLG